MPISFKTQRERLTILYNELMAFAATNENWFPEISERARLCAQDVHRKVEILTQVENPNGQA